jgi:hypothetical protein
VPGAGADQDVTDTVVFWQCRRLPAANKEVGIKGQVLSGTQIAYRRINLEMSAWDSAHGLRNGNG